MYKLAFSCGDPSGIGIEVILKALKLFPKPWPFVPVLFGSKNLFDLAYVQELLKELEVEDYDSDHCQKDRVYLVSVSESEIFQLGCSKAVYGQASLDFLTAASKAVMAGDCQALVTAPINKESWHLAGIPFSGHTDFLKDFCQVDHVTMAFYSARLSLVLATIHCSLMSVAKCLSDPVLLERTLTHAIEFCRGFCSSKPRIAVAGLNPHAGESGLFGSEEIELIHPFVDSCKDSAAIVSGPHSPDTVFLHTVQGQFDCVLALYHDQGLIPLKLLAFDEAVNVTLGLPFLRCSPDHGTAFDIAGQDKANPSSMLAAIRYAIKALG
ncbi:MAG: 4-hydroxythreonine-4-phosphate dehydrogenase PdxA [bacterium]